MTREGIKDELYRMLSDVVNGGYPKRDNAQRGKYKQAVKEAVEALNISAGFINNIRAKIKEEASFAYADFDRYKYEVYGADPDELPFDDFRYGLNRAIEIIDKLETEEEDEDCD